MPGRSRPAGCGMFEALSWHWRWMTQVSKSNRRTSTVHSVSSTARSTSWPSAVGLTLIAITFAVPKRATASATADRFSGAVGDSLPTAGTTYVGSAADILQAPVKRPIHRTLRNPAAGPYTVISATKPRAEVDDSDAAPPGSLPKPQSLPGNDSLHLGIAQLDALAALKAA